jgi:hypothetical protein
MEGVAGASHLPILTRRLLFFVIPTIHAVIDRSASRRKPIRHCRRRGPVVLNPLARNPRSDSPTLVCLPRTSSGAGATLLYKHDVRAWQLVSQRTSPSFFPHSSLSLVPRPLLPLHTPVYRCLVPLPSLLPFPARSPHVALPPARRPPPPPSRTSLPAYLPPY